MRNIRFVQQLVDNEKITPKEGSDDVSRPYAKKAENPLKAAKPLLGQDLLEESVSMSHYAMFHKTTAPLRLTGIKCENHAATITLLKEVFGIDNTTISQAKEERIDKQYYTDFTTTKQDAKELVDKAEAFIATPDMYMEKLTAGQKNNHKRAFTQA